MGVRLIRTAREAFALSAKDQLIFDSLIAFNHLTGRWRYPVPASGDLETMSYMDVVYWVYKSQYPLRKAWRGAGLERYFEEQRSFEWVSPAGFSASSVLEISAVGDLMDHPFLPNSGDHVYADVAETIFDADVSMANLECVIYPQASGSFRVSKKSGPPLYYKKASFDAAKGAGGRKYSLFATANNHSLDFGEAGVHSTIRALKSEGIAWNGTNESERDAESATIVEKNGFKLGVVSHTFGLNAMKPPHDKLWMVNRTLLNGKPSEIDFGRIERQLLHCREQKVDATIAQLHWGMEWEFYPRPDQLEVAHKLAEMGFDLILGHHPHTLQPMENYRTLRDPDRVVPIYYSLGNLITPFNSPDFTRSGIARVTLAKGLAADGSSKTYVRQARLLEVVQEMDSSSETIRLKPQ